MVRWLIVLVLAALVGTFLGCSTTPYGTPASGLKGSHAWQESTAAETRKRLKQLRPGMTKQEVEHLLLEPYKVEMIPTGIEFWLYLTEMPSYNVHGIGMEIMDRHLTPVAFQDGKVIGWGRNFYETALKIKVETDRK